MRKKIILKYVFISLLTLALISLIPFIVGLYYFYIEDWPINIESPFNFSIFLLIKVVLFSIVSFIYVWIISNWGNKRVQKLRFKNYIISLIVLLPILLGFTFTFLPINFLITTIIVALLTSLLMSKELARKYKK